MFNSKRAYLFPFQVCILVLFLPASPLLHLLQSSVHLEALNVLEGDILAESLFKLFVSSAFQFANFVFQVLAVVLEGQIFLAVFPVNRDTK